MCPSITWIIYLRFERLFGAFQSGRQKSSAMTYVKKKKRAISFVHTRNVWARIFTSPKKQTPSFARCLYPDIQNQFRLFMTNDQWTLMFETRMTIPKTEIKIEIKIEAFPGSICSSNRMIPESIKAMCSKLKFCLKFN